MDRQAHKQHILALFEEVRRQEARMQPTGTGHIATTINTPVSYTHLTLPTNREV